MSLDDPALDEFRPAELVPMLRERGGQLAREAATLVG